MKVLKFGGSSVGTAESISGVLEIIERSHDAGEQPIVVLSAMGGVTNQLAELASLAAQGGDFTGGLKAIESRHFSVVRRLITVKRQNPVFTRLKIYLNELEDLLWGVYSLRELSLQSKDLIVSYGERFAVLLVSKIAEQLFPQVAAVDTTELIRTDSTFGCAQVNETVSVQAIQEYMAKIGPKLLFFTGYIAANEKGRVTTLGRGGSDYTAAIIGAALGADAIEIWTDVDGMLTADPRMVKKAFSLPVLSYTEAMELSYFGAKVLYPPAVLPAILKKIPLVIRNTFNPEFAGTWIQDEGDRIGLTIKGISSIPEISVINVAGPGMVGRSGFSGRLFMLLAREQINVVLITQSSSEHSISLAVDPREAGRAIALIEAEFALELHAGQLSKPEIEENLSVLAIVG